MLTPCGPLDGCVTSMAVMLLTYSPSISMAGSGLGQGQGWGQLIKHLQAGERTHGHTQVRKTMDFYIFSWILVFHCVIIPFDSESHLEELYQIIMC